MSPEPIFGTASFGMDGTEFQDESTVTLLLEYLKSAGIKRLDSGARYPPLNPGRSEQLIGSTMEHNHDLAVDTKVIMDTKTDGSGTLTIAAVKKSMNDSLSRLQRTSHGVNILHAHRSDPSTPVREQVKAFNAQIEAGHAKAWGVSNVPISQLKEMFRICEEEGLHKPVCYQGEYNVVTRGMENELLPLLREHGATFNAFRPLSAGFLTGKATTGNTAGTRFGDDNPLSKAISGLFSAEDLNQAMQEFIEATQEHGLTTIEVAIRWIFYHSALSDQDGVILGASKMSQVKETLKLIKRGPLPSDVLKLTENIWAAVKESRAAIT